MSWQRKQGHEHNHIDGRTGVHFARLENTATGGEHELHILLGVDSCPHCHRPFPADDLGAVDPKAVVADALAMLTANHDAVLAYAQKHGIPVRTSHPSPKVPDGFRPQKHGEALMLMPPPRQQ